MAYATVGGGLDAEPAIELSQSEGYHIKTGTRTLQDARLPCDKRMTYAAVRGGMNTESAISILGRKRSGYKNGYSDFAGCPIAMQ